MLLCEVRRVKKYYGDRLVVEIPNLTVYGGERVGVVGPNGAGKTTMLHLLAGKLMSDEGRVKRWGSLTLVEQYPHEGQEEAISQQQARRFKTALEYDTRLSGGEKTRFRLAQALEEPTDLLLVDEPTSHLDIGGMEFLQECFLSYSGAIVMVSHDRELLDAVCTRMIEVADGGIREYPGNYSCYLTQREQCRARQQMEYEHYQRDKQRIEQAIQQKREQIDQMRNTPKRMGNAEARLHKRKVGGAKAKVAKQIKSLETRMAKLEPKEKPLEWAPLQLDFASPVKVHSDYLVRAEGITKEFGSRVLWDKLFFQVKKGSKFGVIGDNGTGKTTLLRMIARRDQVFVADSCRIGYFSQELDILRDDRSILENVMTSSSYQQGFVRTVLGRLLFRGDEVHKVVSLLSGGERVRVCLAKLLLSAANLLVLDEPTNFLDVDSQEALEQVLAAFPGTMIFASHDRRLLSRLATGLLVLENRRGEMFPGSYQDYVSRDSVDNDPSRLLLLENRLAEVTSRLAMPGKQDDTIALDEEFQELIREIRELRKS